MFQMLMHGEVGQKLTPSEKEILFHLTIKTPKSEIAKIRKRSRKTIEAQVFNIHKKLKIKKAEDIYTLIKH